MLLVAQLVLTTLGWPVLLAGQSAASPPLQGTLSDPTGDVRPSATMPVPPDLVSARVDVRDGTLTLTVAFAKGTLSDRTSLNVYFDIDEDARTGWVRDPQAPEAAGIDYEISPLSPHDPARGALRIRSGGRNSRMAGLVEWTSPAPDQKRVALPLSRLGNDDGRLTFALECNHILEESSSGTASLKMIASHVDLIPNHGLRPGRVR
jgi:hypothetical protein